MNYMGSMFWGCRSLTSLDLSTMNTTFVNDMSGMFSGCTSLAALDLSGIKTGNVKSMFHMFSWCSSLTSIDLSDFDTSNVREFDSMFEGCSSLQELDISSFVINLDYSDEGWLTSSKKMFEGCEKLNKIKTPQVVIDSEKEYYPILPYIMYEKKADGTWGNSYENLMDAPAKTELFFRLDINQFEVTFSGYNEFIFNKGIHEPELEVRYNGYSRYSDDRGDVLTKDISYRVSYKNNVNAGTATAVVTGIGLFDGVLVEKTFTIKPKEVYNLSIGNIGKQVYDGSAFMPKPVVTYDGTTLVYGKDYELLYENNIDAGYGAKVIVVAKGNYSGKSSRQLIISPRNISETQISDVPDQPYDGHSKCPTPTVRFKGKTLIKDKDYQLYYGNNYRVGDAYVTISGKGNFTGNVKKTFKIVSSSIKVKSVRLSKNSASLEKGKTLTLRAIVTPSNATNKKVVWKSNNTKVATVDSKGIVKCVKKGKATITVTTKDGNKKATCAVTVTNPVVKVKGVKLNKKTASVKKGKTITLKATISPSNATNKNMTWTTSNKKIATVSAKGVVKGVKKGKTIITVTTKDGKKKAACKVTVR